MSKYCPIAEEITNCTDNCKTCMEEEIKMHDTYKITLSIYPIADCGEDLRKGEPLEVSYEGNDLDAMKLAINNTVIAVMKELNVNDGLTLVECDIEKNGEYFDNEEGYYRVDLANNTAKFLIG